MDTEKQFIKDYLTRYTHPRSFKIQQYILTAFTGFLAEIGIERPQDVTFTHLAEYRIRLEGNDYSRSTVRVYMESVKNFFNALETSGLIFVNPAESLVLPKDVRTPEPVPEEADMKKLLELPDLSSPFGIRDRALLETVYTCALRRDEIVRLTVFDAVLDQNELKVKGKKARKVPLPDQTAERLKAYIVHVRPNLVKDPDQTGLWVSRRTRRTLSLTQIKRLIRTYGEKAGCHMSIKSVRKAGIRYMLKNGIPPDLLPEVLGYAGMKGMTRTGLSIGQMRELYERYRHGGRTS